MLRLVFAEILCATPSFGDNPDGTRGPIRKYNALRQSQKKKLAPLPAIPAFPVSLGVPAKDTASETHRLPLAARYRVARSTIGCYSGPQPQFPSAQAVQPDPASAQ